jgi:LuxR family maltose regulon positive regulatory protein
VATLVSARQTGGHEYSGRLAGQAFVQLPITHPLRPLARLLEGWSVTVGGDVRKGRRLIDHSASLSESMGLATTWVEALSLRAVTEWAQGDGESALASVRQAHEVWVERSLMDASATSVLLHCAATVANAAAHDAAAAREAIAQAYARADAVHASLPWIDALRHTLNASAYADMGEIALGNGAVEQARRTLTRLPSAPFLDHTLSKVSGRLADAAAPARLSPAELRVAGLIDSPLSAAAIGDRLGLSTETVKSHLSSIYRKLDVARRHEAAEILARARSQHSHDGGASAAGRTD